MATVVGQAGSLAVRGQAELERAFMQLRREVFAELKGALLEAGEEVRKEAEGLAHGHVHVDDSGREVRIGPKWERMRLGVSVRSGVYVVPFSKRRGGSPRPEFKSVLQPLMDKALEDKGDEAVHSIEALVTASAAKNGFIVI